MIRLKKHAGGFTIVEIMIVVLIIGLLATIGAANYRRATEDSRRNACISNLRQIDAAKNQWAIEHYEPDQTTPAEEDLDPFIRGGIAKVYCPMDATRTFANSYDINDLGSNATCRLAPTKHIVSSGSS